MTIILHDQIEKINDIFKENLDSLIDSTLESAIEKKTFEFPNKATLAEKREFLLNSVYKEFARDDSFFFKRTLDGDIISIIGGRKQDNGEYLIYTLGLVKQVNGSRAWLHAPGIAERQRDFLKSNGFVGFYYVTLPNVAQTEIIRYEKIGATIERLPMKPGQNVAVTKITFN